MPSNIKKNKDLEKGPSEQWLEFENRWVHFDLLHLRVENAKMLYELKSEMNRFVLFGILFYMYLIQTSMVSTRFSQKELFEEKFTHKPFVTQSSEYEVTDYLNRSKVSNRIYTTYKDWHGIAKLEEMYDWIDQVLFPNVWGEESINLNYSLTHGNQYLWGVHMRQLRVQPSNDLIQKGACRFPSYGNLDSNLNNLNVGYEELCHPVYGDCKYLL
jgi:hypothetical protein